MSRAQGGQPTHPAEPDGAELEALLARCAEGDRSALETLYARVAPILLAVLGLVHLPARWVESAIALTVLLGALNNLKPLIVRRRWAVAFAFGLVHGLGFASVLADLGLHGANLALSLLGFNLGVELGQMLIVLAVLPLAFLARHSRIYRRTFMPVGSAAIVLLAAYWMVARMTGANLG